MDNLTGQKLSDQYILEKQIGSGGMADVYKAWDSKRSINIAIKVLHHRLSNNRRIVAMFEKEAKILKELGHPNIARLYEFRKHGEFHFLVLDWVDGESLDRVIKNRKGPLTLAEVTAILSPIVSALHYLHSNDVLHCDIKPGNILIATNRQIFLTDLGVARSANSAATGGTPIYMAPEQFQSGKVSHKTDIYSLGVTVFEMLTGGQLPFTGKSPNNVGSTLYEKIAWEHVNLPLPSLQQFNRNIPDNVSQVLEKALAKQPDSRFNSVLDFFNSYEFARVNGNDFSDIKIKQNLVSESTVSDIVPKSKKGQIIPKQIDQNDITPKQYRYHQRLIGLSGELKNKIILISHDQLSFGRNSQMQVRFTDPQISRTHATLFKTSRGIILKDDNSSVGTYVNNKQIERSVILQHGDKILFGNNQLLEFRDK